MLAMLGCKANCSCRALGARKRSNVRVAFLTADGIVRVNVFFHRRKQVYQFEINCLNAGSILNRN